MLKSDLSPITHQLSSSKLPVVSGSKRLVSELNTVKDVLKRWAVILAESFILQLKNYSHLCQSDHLLPAFW